MATLPRFDGGGDVAELVTIEGQRYVKRDPLGVLGLSFITIGIYWFYWYYKVNDEIRRYEKDDSVRPGIALLAVTLGRRSSPCTTRRSTSSGWRSAQGSRRCCRRPSTSSC